MSKLPFYLQASFKANCKEGKAVLSWSDRAVTKISSCWVIITSGWGIQQLRIHLLLLFFYFPIEVAWDQPPPQALRFSHDRGERETSDWWWTARDHGKGTDGRQSLLPAFLWAHIFIKRETSGYKAGLGVGSITSRCSGKWARTHPPEVVVVSLRGGSRPDPGDGGNRAYVHSNEGKSRAPGP